MVDIQRIAERHRKEGKSDQQIVEVMRQQGINVSLDQVRMEVVDRSKKIVEIPKEIEDLHDKTVKSYRDFVSNLEALKNLKKKMGYGFSIEKGMILKMRSFNRKFGK